MTHPYQGLKSAEEPIASGRAEANADRMDAVSVVAPHEDGELAKARHFVAHPEDQDANVVIFKFCTE